MQESNSTILSLWQVAFLRGPLKDLKAKFNSIINFLLSLVTYRKNSENKPRGIYFSKALFQGLIFGGVYIRRGLSTEGNLRFKIDWANLIVGSKFTVFALFYFVLKGSFS